MPGELLCAKIIATLEECLVVLTTHICTEKSAVYIVVELINLLVPNIECTQSKRHPDFEFIFLYMKVSILFILFF